MRTLKQAQVDLAAFDANRWPHNPGVNSIRYVHLYLRHAASRFLEKLLHIMNDQLWEDAIDFWKVELLDRFMEHGIRLANNCFLDLEDKLSIIFEKPSTLERHPELPESSWFDGVNYTMKTDGLSRVDHFRNLMLNSLGSLDHFRYTCERLDYGEVFDEEKKECVETTAIGLIGWVILFHLLDHKECSEQEIVDHIVTIFDRRLALLTKQREYSP